ncbi:rhodanese-like domain-containing protein [Endozoicomonas sp. OPT23]|uniref:rhodanese-like domain-containing protein n=1 Tax=Endozoicomonas sp. OPT23 TaxID=2072845 RepID=UPI00129AF174|nr:rhodanese-like domain-containing protein [Endozoicomonas sp. OPT23]MRI32566.1 rhodanese-like domain-containing protein [Endozoicomonas sp. OPT23]
MEQLIVFIGNHPLLVGSLVALVAILMVTELRKGGKTISSQEVTILINQQNGVVLDVRDPADFSKGHIVDAISMPHGKVTERMGELNKHKDKPIIIVDAMGQHAGTVGKQLLEAGFTQAVRLQGGISTWSNDGLPLVKK